MGNADGFLELLLKASSKLKAFSLVTSFVNVRKSQDRFAAVRYAVDDHVSTFNRKFDKIREIDHERLSSLTANMA